GPPPTKKTSASAAANQGLSTGNHANSKTLRRPSDPLFQSRPAQVPSGNQVALNAAGAKAGPGAGRILHGQAGSQGTHGRPVQGSAPAPRDILSEFGPESARRR